MDEDAEKVGYKAQNLGWLITNGFNCPDGFVVTSDEFSPMISDYLTNREIEMSKFVFYFPETIIVSIEKSLKNYDSTDIDLYFGISQEIIKEKLKEDSHIKGEIKAWLENLKFEYAYARSSTNRGDSLRGSYAGAYRSLPFICKEIGNIFEEMVSEIIGSIFSLEALQTAIVRYKERLEDYINDIKIAIVFQKMEEKEPYISGLARFCRGEMNVVIAQGLGEVIMPYHYKLEGNKETFDYRKKKGWDKISNLCVARYKDGKPQPFALEPQDGVYVINEHRGWGTIYNPLNQEKRIVDISGIKKILSWTFDTCNRISISKPIYTNGLSIEFVIWYGKDENDLQVVQVRQNTQVI